MRPKFILFIPMYAILAVSLTAQTAAPSSAPPVIAPAAPVVTGTPATSQGQNLPVISEVSSAITIDAVLLPKSVTRRVFGNEIASKYAAVSITTANRDPKQSLIIQSVLLDYSNWLFSGSFSALGASGSPVITNSQQSNTQNQVASVEVRIVRGQMQDAQLWSFRNWVIRSAVAAGTVAAGLSFASSSAYFANSISAYSADFVPALSVLWPDNTQAHSDLISDIGFRTNHVVPAQSADIVVAFFPLDRFLTSDLKKIYLKEPAAFFNPSELVLSKNKERGLLLTPLANVKLIEDDKEAGARKAVGAIMDYEKAYAISKFAGKSVDPCIGSSTTTIPSTDECVIVELLNRASLNNIHVVIGGIMSVDTNAVPATVTAVSIDKDTTAGTWLSGKTISATLTGTFLSGGSVTLTGVDSTAAATALPVADFGSVANVGTVTDASLPVTFTLGADIKSGSKLTFIVTKKAKDGSTTTSVPFIYTVPPAS